MDTSYKFFFGSKVYKQKKHAEYKLWIFFIGIA